MKFTITEEQSFIRSTIRQFAEEKVAPLALEADENEHFHDELFRQMGELGLAGIPIPELYGGLSSNILTYAIVLEELARVCASTSAVLAAHTAYTLWPVYRFGSNQLKNKYMHALTSGSKLGGVASPSIAQPFTSPEHSVQFQLIRDYVVLQGTHSFVVNASSADVYTVYAQAKVDGRWSAFLVESNTPGLTNGNKVHKLGLRSLMTAELIFNQCRVPKSSRIGRSGQGLEIAGDLSLIGQISAAAQAVGIAQGALEAATSYATERKQFGELIGRRQGISFKLADMAANLEGARWLVYQAAWRMDEKLSCGKEAAIAISYAAETAVSVSLEAVQIFGGYGYMQEYKVERMLRDAKCMELSMATGGMEFDYITPILTE